MPALSRSVFCVIIVGAVTSSLLQAADKPQAGATPTPSEIRKAVERSLPFLESEGIAWIQKNACITCHQIPAMV